MRSFAIVIHRAYFEAKKRRKYTKNIVVSRSESPIRITSLQSESYDWSTKTDVLRNSKSVSRSILLTLVLLIS